MVCGLLVISWCVRLSIIVVRLLVGLMRNVSLWVLCWLSSSFCCWCLRFIVVLIVMGVRGLSSG